VPVHLSSCIQLENCWTDLHEILYWKVSWKTVVTFQYLFWQDNVNKYFTLTPNWICILRSICTCFDMHRAPASQQCTHTQVPLYSEPISRLGK
jgi:hypothetical protein